MVEYKFNGCTVRIHGTPNIDNIKKATARFAKKAIAAKKKKSKENEKLL